jgi:tetratricopeptide (TPR) repeat protein
MYFRAKLQPLAKPTARDMLALNSLYVTAANDFIDDGFDALDSGQYKMALTFFDKAIAANQKNDQMRNAICVHLINAATDVLSKGNYADALSLLRKTNEIAADTLPEQMEKQLLKDLHYALVQLGRLKEAQALEKQDASLKGDVDSSAAYLDQYGLKRESMPFYEKALAKSPDDLAVRGKFCFLLVMLARDESNKDNDDEAIALLIRAKSLLRPGVPPDAVSKVMGALRREYEKLERYDEAEHLQLGYSVPKSPPYSKRNTPEEDMAELVSAAKKSHPADWSRPGDVISSHAKIKRTCDDYVSALRMCACTEHVKDAPVGQSRSLSDIINTVVVALMNRQGKCSYLGVVLLL